VSGATTFFSLPTREAASAIIYVKASQADVKGFIQPAFILRPVSVRLLLRVFFHLSAGSRTLATTIGFEVITVDVFGSGGGKTKPTSPTFYNLSGLSSENQFVEATTFLFLFRIRVRVFRPTRCEENEPANIDFLPLPL
jgi:hypothetical protein